MKSILKTKASLRAVGAIALMLFATAVGCAPDVPQDEDVERSQTVFDSATGTIPLPSDLALEDDGTLPNLGADLPVSAQADFYAYLDTLHGWLPSTPLTVPVDGDVDADALSPEAAMVFRLTEDGAESLEVASVSWDADASQIVITPAAPLELGTQYGYVLTQDVTDPAGNPVVASPQIFFQTSSQPLVDEDGNITNSLLAGAATPAEAAQLEQVRQFMAPVVNAAVAEGVERSEIIAVTNFHTALDTFAVFDPTAGVVPFPNEFIRNPENGNVGLPLPEDADDLTTAVINELNSRDGFSITADGYIPVSGGPLDESTVTHENIPLAWVADPLPVRYEVDEYYLEYREEFGSILFGPESRPFRQGRLNAGVVTTSVTDANGFAIKPSSAFVFLRSRNPVFEDGASTVEQLDDAQAEALEAARQDYEQLFIAAATLGIQRGEVAGAWAFETDAVTEYQQQLSAVAEASYNAAGETTPIGDPTTAEADPADFENVGIIQRQAAYTTSWFLDLPDNPLVLLEDPETQPVPVVITVPSDDNCTVPDDGYPIVILGHGDGGNREDAVELLSDELAAAPYCLATIAPDFPLHGLRTPDGMESGELFLTANAILTKNNFLQAVVDLSVLTEVIKSDRLENALDVDPNTNLIDESQIGYAAYSLGALIGTNFLATDGDVNVGALTTPGAKITDILLGGDFADMILPQLPGDLEPGTFDFFQTFSLLQWVIEPADPWSFAPHVIAEPLAALVYDVDNDEFSADDSLPSNEVLIQMAGQDSVIPNFATELLAGAIGVSLDDTTFPDAEHSLLRGDDAGCASEQIAAWLSSGFSDGAALPSELEAACAGQ
jgi:predicted esterase